MKNLFILLMLLPALGACEPPDKRTKAANMIYKSCIENNQGKEWCRCLRADLIDADQAFTEEIANYVVNRRRHPFLNMVITGAQIRCECRMFPKRMASGGLSCAEVKPIKF